MGLAKVGWMAPRTVHGRGDLAPTSFPECHSKIIKFQMSRSFKRWYSN